MDGLINLDQALKEIVAARKLSREDSTEREQIIEKLRIIVARSSSLGGASVVPYGSFVAHLSTISGDLDMSINIPMPPNQALGLLKNLLQEQDGWENLKHIATANVPVLKFDHGGISCDVTVNNWSSQVKSKILFLIGQMDARFHDMVVLVKEWAQMKGINDSTNKTFSSYCLTLLIVYHFQTRVPPILPPLYQIYSKNVSVVLQGDPKNDVMQQIVQECANNIAIWRSRRRVWSINHSSLSELFISFMDKYCHLFESDPKVVRICTSSKSWSTKYDNNRVALIVVDPFEKTDNVAKTVWKESRSKISRAFKSALDGFCYENGDQVASSSSSHQAGPKWVA